MSAPKSLSFSELAKKVIKIYKDFFKEDELKDTQLGDKFQERLELLYKIKKDNYISDEFNEGRIGIFLKSVFDAKTISLCSNSDDLFIENRNLLPKKKKVKGEIKDKGLDNYFSRFHFQGWANSQDNNKLKDLEQRYKQEEGERCDFLLEDSNTLIEVKRIHSSSSKRRNLNYLLNSGKIDKKLRKAASQLKTTKELLNEKEGRKINYKKFMLDVSPYGERDCKQIKNDPKIVIKALSKEKVRRIETYLRNKEEEFENSIDKVMITWLEEIMIEGVPRGLRKCTVPIKLSNSEDPSPKYNGLSIFGYPRPDKGIDFGELRYQVDCQSIGKVSTRYNNYSDNENFWTSGNWQVKDD